MNTQLNIKTRQLFSPAFVTLLIGIVVVLVFGGPSVQAQTTAPAATVESSVTLPVKGTVSDPGGTITFSGNVLISCKRVIDTTAATPANTALVVLDFDFSGLTGTSGSVKTQRTFVTGDNHATEIRPLVASDTIIVTTPYFDSTRDALSARTMLVTASLNFDVASGKLTGGSLSLGNNVVTSAAVGTITAAPIQ